MNIVIFGPQGSGKGTQAEKLAQHFDAEHIDMGKFLREVAKMDTPLGQEVWQIQNVTKTLVPARVLEEVFTIKLNDIPREKNIVFDGFPRNVDQMQYFEKAMSEFGRAVDAAIYIKLSQKESFRRISKRWMCAKCKKVFIMGKDIENEKEKCDACGGQIIQRTDDTQEGIAKRLEVFQEETMPVIDFYREQDKLIEVDGAGSIEEVYENILKELSEI